MIFSLSLFEEDYWVTILAFNIFFIISFYAVIRPSMLLKTIEIRNDAIAISNFRRSIMVNITEIENIDRLFLSKAYYFIELKQNTIFGKKIIFMSKISETISAFNSTPTSIKHLKKLRNKL